MTPDITTHIHESNLIEGFDSDAMDTAAADAWAWLTTVDELTCEVVLELHRQVVAPQPDPRWVTGKWKGLWRTGGIRVGYYLAPPWQDVPDLMRDHIAALQTSLQNPDGLWVLAPQPAHVWFEHIHPFHDGNGRVGRLLMWWHEHRLGLPPTLIRYSDRHTYYQWFTPRWPTLGPCLHCGCRSYEIEFVDTWDSRLTPGPVRCINPECAPPDDTDPRDHPPFCQWPALPPSGRCCRRTVAMVRNPRNLRNPADDLAVCRTHHDLAAYLGWTTTCRVGDDNGRLEDHR